MSVLLGRVRRGGPEEVLLPGWGYGRSRTDPFPPRMGGSPSLILHGLQRWILLPHPLEC